jgi:hypothetical protein
MALYSFDHMAQEARIWRGEIREHLFASATVMMPPTACFRQGMEHRMTGIFTLRLA